MFEIEIKIDCPDGNNHLIGRCNDTRCLTEKGKRGFICENCPITLMERKHNEELGNVRERVHNVIYMQRNIVKGCLREISDDEEKLLYRYMNRIFDEKPIKSLI
jgi:hypothetical protein